jgi:hypothetical protein
MLKHMRLLLRLLVLYSIRRKNKNHQHERGSLNVLILKTIFLFLFSNTIKFALNVFRPAHMWNKCISKDIKVILTINTSLNL